MIREDALQFKSGVINLFYAGDIMQKSIKDMQLVLDWGLFNI